jgi:sterol desaturase/sphingolipid hydroxylase (fatty acid hydroxylase superfamily)
MAKSLEAAVPWLAYPVLMTTILWLHFFLRHEGAGIMACSFGPVALGALVITCLERRYPHRKEWQPDGEDVKGDATFMVLVQILLPKALAFLLAVSVLRGLKSHDLSLAVLWPHALPPVVQAALMLMTADFFRYWLHRASHEWSMRLWSLHAVHHSPQKLYWVNVGRFHPIEKSLQFLLDAAPFIVLGVGENVLAIYFVFYAVNGFFQHCNIALRLGLLNYVISGPELHRWHHSREIRESNTNYGNNLILWDLLFRSFFLPKDREVETLGLINRNYPQDFLSQMRTPFIKGIDKNES